MMEATLSVPNAILFVLDPGNKNAIVPVYNQYETIAANPTCLSIKTLAEVDGDVTIRLGHPQTGLEDVSTMTVFEGEIETPGRVIAIITSLFERVLETNVQHFRTRISIGVDDPEVPSIVTVRVG
jgi:hypothetical protein